MTLAFIKAPEVRRRRAQGNTSVYTAVKAGLLTPPIKLGRSSAWLEREVDTISAALLAGQTNEQIRSLVNELVKARATLLASYRARQVAQP